MKIPPNGNRKEMRDRMNRIDRIRRTGQQWDAEQALGPAQKQLGTLGSSSSSSSYSAAAALKVKPSLEGLSRKAGNDDEDERRFSAFYPR
jgi:hypothetical protein